MFLVTWEMNIDAATPSEAARKAWEYMRAPDSTANAFTITDEAGNAVQVDLSDVEVRDHHEPATDGLGCRCEEIAFAHTPETCPSKHWNRGDDVCADCGADLNN